MPPRFAETLGRFHEIWAPSEFVRSAFAEALDVPVFRVPFPVELSSIAPVSRARYGLPQHATLFLFAFDPARFSCARTPSPWSRPFKQAFAARGPKEVALVIKTLDAGPHAGILKTLRQAIGGDPRMHLIEGTVARAEMNGLLAAADVFVSLHRSEGFGFGLAEAMLLGKPVVGTAYSGNADFSTAPLATRCPIASCRCSPATIRSMTARSGPSRTSPWRRSTWPRSSTIRSAPSASPRPAKPSSRPITALPPLAS